MSITEVLLLRSIVLPRNRHKSTGGESNGRSTFRELSPSYTSSNLWRQSRFTKSSTTCAHS